jgi:hypothetical protein
MSHPVEVVHSEKFLLVLEIETDDLANVLSRVEELLVKELPEAGATGWITRGLLIDDVKAILSLQVTTEEE